MALMKTFLLLLVTASLLADSTVQKGLESAIAYREHDACEQAKKAVLAREDVVDYSRCSCERTDAGEWQCFVKFAYEASPADK